MAQQNIAQPTYPASGNTSWKGTLETILESFRLGINKTDLSTDPRPALSNPRGAWAANTAYAIGDVVKQNSRVYRAITAFTSGATFNTANWSDEGSDVAAAGSGTAGIPVQASRFKASQAYSTPFVVGVSNGTPSSAAGLFLARVISGRAWTTGTLLTASFLVNTAGTSIHPVLYKMDPDTLTLTLVADFGAVDTSATGNKQVTGVASLIDIAVGDYLMVGGGSPTTTSSVQVVSGFDPWFPFPPTNSIRPAGLLVNSTAVPAPSTVQIGTGTGTASVWGSATASIPLIYITVQS